MSALAPAQSASVIENWGIKAGQAPWGTPPELAPYFLVGEVNGQNVETLIHRRDDETFVCENGAHYTLGEVHPEYDKHCNGKARALALSGFRNR